MCMHSSQELLWGPLPVHPQRAPERCKPLIEELGLGSGLASKHVCDEALVHHKEGRLVCDAPWSPCRWRQNTCRAAAGTACGSSATEIEKLRERQSPTSIQPRQRHEAGSVGAALSGYTHILQWLGQHPAPGRPSRRWGCTRWAPCPRSDPAGCGRTASRCDPARPAITLCSRWSRFATHLI